MVEKKVQKTKAQSDYLSDSVSSGEEVNPHLHTSQEERVYSTKKDLHRLHRQCYHTQEHRPTQWWKEDY